MSINKRTIICIMLFYLYFLSSENLISKYASPFVLKSLNILALATIFLAFFVLRSYYIKTTLKPRSYELLLISYLFVCFVSGYFNRVNLINTFNSALYETKYILLFMSITLARFSDEDYRFFQKGCIIWGVWQILLGVIQYFGSDYIRSFFLDTQYMSTSAKLYEHVLESHRIVGTFLNKNIFAFFILFCVIILVKSRNLYSKSITLLLISINLFGVILSGSRTVWVIVLLFFLSQLHWNRKRIIIASLLLLISITISGYTIKQLGEIQDKSTLLYKATEIFQPEYYDIIVNFGRLAYVLATIDIIKEHPLTGIGGGEWGTGFAYKDSEDYEHIQYGGYSIPKGVMHDNNYASISGQFGLLALILFISLIISIKYHCSNKNIDVTDFDQVSYIYILSMLLISFTWTPFASKPISFLFWSIVGLSSAVRSSVTNTHNTHIY